MKHYKLTAEQMQQVREKVHRLACLGNGDRFGTSIGNGIAQDALALLDAAMQAPEATAGGDVREAAEAMVCVVDGYINETATIHQLKAANASLAAALAAAPKPCEHGCVDGKVLITPARGNNYEAPCPIHGTKPEAPTDATPKDEETGR